MEAAKADDDGSKKPKSQPLCSEWALSTTNEIEPVSKLFCVKQEDMTADEIGESISEYSDYLHTCGGRLRNNKAELELKSNCFLDMQSLKSEMLPAMEALQLKDTVERRFSIDDTSQLLAETFSDESNFSDDHRLSGGPRCLPYEGGKYRVADDRLTHLSSQPRDLKMLGLAENSRVAGGQQAVAAVSKYKMLGPSGVNSSSTCGAGQLCGPSGTAGNMLRRNIAGCKMRKSARRPLTPSYLGQRGFVLPCPTSSVVQGVSTAQRTPLSSFAGRTIYRASHDQAQPSVNSAIFEFPPSNNLLDSNVMSHSATPVHSSYSLAQQRTPHTPLSPYTPQPNAPYTPKNSAAASSHLSCFQFPPSTSGLIETANCESPYLLHQKSAYHPYSSLHHPSLPSPRYAQLHHHQLQQQLKSNNFEHDVMQMNKEIEQHLQQFIEEDHKKTVLQLDQSYHNQQNESDLYLPLGAHCLDSGQAGIREAFICGQDQNVNPPISFGKYQNQQKVFLDEKLGREGNEFDMELELDPLSILNLSNTDKVLDNKSRFSETSVDQANDLNHLDVIDMLIMEDQYEDLSNEMAALDEIPNVDVLSGRNGLSQVSRDIDLGIDILASEVMSGVTAGDRCALRSVSKWMNRENLPRFLDVGKDEIFLNPNQIGNIKKKKRRPDPLIIPPCVNNFQTVTSPQYSPDMVTHARKDTLPPAHPPPPYSALPVNGLAKGDLGSFQMPFDVRTPQSAPTFHYAEDRLMCKSMLICILKIQCILKFRCIVF